MTSYRHLRFVVQTGAEERLVAELWAGGMLGSVQRAADGERLEVEAFFPFDRLITETDARALAGAVSGVELAGFETVHEADWMAAYRRQAEPFHLGRRFWVDPREPDDNADEHDPPAPNGRQRLLLPARRAFGTGSHASTALVVEILEDLPLEGLSVLDVGCGTGVLALVALERGAGRVVGVEIDSIAAADARDNQRLNGREFPLVAGDVNCLGPAGAVERFGLILVNVLPERIEAQLETISRLAAPGGRAVFSGLLADAGPADRRLLGELERLGWRLVARRTRQEWQAVIFESQQRSDR